MCAVAQRSSEYQGSSELPRIPILRTRVNSSLGLSTTDRHRPPEHEAVRSYPWLRQKYEERIKGRGEKKRIAAPRNRAPQAPISQLS